MEFHKTLYLTVSTPQRNALCYGNSHKIVFHWQCWRASHCNTQAHKHELWIWFTLCYAMMRALLRLAAVWDTKQTGDLRGDTVQFIASSSALVLMTQNGNIYPPLTQTATCPLPRYRSKHIAENSQWISQTTNSLTALLTKRDQLRFCEIVNTCTERRAEKRIQRTAWILSHVLRKTLCEHVNGLCPAGWLNEQSITKHWFQSVRTCPSSWATGGNTTVFLKLRYRDIVVFRTKNSMVENLVTD